MPTNQMNFIQALNQILDPAHEYCDELDCGGDVMGQAFCPHCMAQIELPDLLQHGPLVRLDGWLVIPGNLADRTIRGRAGFIASNERGPMTLYDSIVKRVTRAPMGWDDAVRLPFIKKSVRIHRPGCPFHYLVENKERLKAILLRAGAT